MIRTALFLVSTLFFFHQNQISAQCWDLVWEDNFSGSSLNSANWSYQIGAGGWGNNELQYYTDRTDNVNVTGGNLEIIAKSEVYMGANYTSGRIRTINKVDYTYGRFEASLKTPFGQGIWPAFWMLPTNNVYGGWPNSGEIDIMELLGHQPAKAYGTAHYSLNGNHQFVGEDSTLVSGDFSQSFHEFAVEWKPDTIDWFIDGAKYFTLTANDIAPANWIFDQDFHFILNVAVGGNWPGSPNGTTSFPQTMEVDYVRVYQLLEDVTITGQTYVNTCQAAVNYSTPNISGATYSWSVPSGASITSGAGTEAIVVNFNGNQGDVCCDVTTGCGTETTCLNVTVSNNFWENSDFEDDLNHWSTNTRNGGIASFSVTTSNPQQGAKSALVDVTSTATNVWDIQLGRSGFEVESGENYTLEYWAKADASGKTVTAAFIDADNYSWISGTTQTITDSWQQYSHSFTPSSTTEALFNFDLGDELGDFDFDDVWFGKTSTLPVELGFFEVAASAEKDAVELNWTTFSEINSDRFEIEFASAKNDFQTIGTLPAKGFSTSEEHYYFVHENPSPEQNFYRLKQIDQDGSHTYSEVRSVFFDSKNELFVFPNPTRDVIRFSNSEQIEQVLIYDSHGRLHFKSNQNQTDFSEINLSDFEQGEYFLKIISGRKVEVFLIGKI